MLRAASSRGGGIGLSEPEGKGDRQTRDSQGKAASAPLVYHKTQRYRQARTAGRSPPRQPGERRSPWWRTRACRGCPCRTCRARGWPRSPPPCSAGRERQQGGGVRRPPVSLDYVLTTTFSIIYRRLTHLHEVLAVLLRHLVVPVRVHALHLALLLHVLPHLRVYVWERSIHGEVADPSRSPLFLRPSPSPSPQAATVTYVRVAVVARPAAIVAGQRRQGRLPGRGRRRPAPKGLLILILVQQDAAPPAAVSVLLHPLWLGLALTCCRWLLLRACVYMYVCRRRRG